MIEVKGWQHNSKVGDLPVMGRTIPSFRIALAMEKEAEWKKLFYNALDKSDRKKFDEMFDIPRLYISLAYFDMITRNSLSLLLLLTTFISISMIV